MGFQSDLSNPVSHGNEPPKHISAPKPSQMLFPLTSYFTITLSPIYERKAYSYVAFQLKLIENTAFSSNA